MGRISKQKRQLILEANKRLLNEVENIEVVGNEEVNVNGTDDKGINLESVKND